MADKDSPPERRARMALANCGENLLGRPLLRRGRDLGALAMPKSFHIER